jgi:exodeoxyribonuclease-3
MTLMRLPTILLTLVIVLPLTESHSQELKVMSFNLWHGGEAGGQPLSQTVDAIRKSQADIVGLQETHGHEVDGVRLDNGHRIAKQLGWKYFPQGGRTGILSKFPIRVATKDKWGVEIEYAAGRTLVFFNAHFHASPYQPYQLLGISYGDAPFIKTESQAIEWANRSRGEQVQRLLSEIQLAVSDGKSIVLTGDFNEPSFQDWTASAAAAKVCSIKVEYPATKRITEAGLTDAWRVAHPNEVALPGRTWTPTTSPDDPKDRHDRIDFVFVSSKGVTVNDCQRVGEAGNSEIIVQPWPSDHRAVVATIVISEP